MAGWARGRPGDGRASAAVTLPLRGSCAAASRAQGGASRPHSPRPSVRALVPEASHPSPGPGLSPHTAPLPRPAVSPGTPGHGSHRSFDTFFDCLAHPLASPQDTSRLSGTPSPIPPGPWVQRWGGVFPSFTGASRSPRSPSIASGDHSGDHSDPPGGGGARLQVWLRCASHTRRSLSPGSRAGPLCPAPPPLAGSSTLRGLRRKLQRS